MFGSRRWPGEETLKSVERGRGVASGAAPSRLDWHAAIVTAEAPLFTFDRVAVDLATGHLLDEVSAAVEARGITVVVGPSGAGKTTLLRLCNRLEAPTSGQVLFHGDDVATLDPLALRRRVGMVVQRPTLFAGTVRDNLLEAGESLADDDLVGALDRVGLPASFLDRRRDELSGGQAQRACLARTLLTEPEVLLMDEPTSSLDPDGRLGIERLAMELARGDISVLWVTHDLDQARRLADRTVVLVDGRVADDDQAAAFLARRPEEDVDGH
jgi:putative ABC transport system ATP-binding protein